MQSPLPESEPPPQEPASPPPPPSSGLRLQVIANAVTVVVAVAAIGLSVWEGYENRLHNRLSVMPHLERAESTIRDSAEDSTYTMIYAVDNTGLGPAVLDNIMIYRDSVLFYDAQASGGYMPMNDLLADLRSLPFPLGSTFTNTRRAGEMLEAGRDHLLLRFEVPVLDSLERWVPGMVREEVMSRYSIVFCYCSVYGSHCGQTHISAAPPTANVCPR